MNVSYSVVFWSSGDKCFHVSDNSEYAVHQINVHVPEHCYTVHTHSLLGLNSFTCTYIQWDYCIYLSVRWHPSPFHRLRKIIMHTFVCHYKVTLYFSVDDWINFSPYSWCTSVLHKASLTTVTYSCEIYKRSLKSLVPFRTEPLTHWWLIYVWVEGGTTVIGNCWVVYRDLNMRGYTHQSVNPNILFVGLCTGA
jgi:hypothetical protein